MLQYAPHPYQDHATAHIIQNDISGLLLEMGLGKTISTLTAIDQVLYDYFDSYKILVIAPLRVAEDTWSTEVDKWTHTKDLTVSKILGTAKQREAALQVKADIYIINRENVVWLVDFYRKRWPFDFVIIDELSSFKSHGSQRFKALRKVRPLIKKIVGLTGTPAPNGLLDLWSQVYLLDQGERLGKTFTSYRDTYFEPARIGKNAQGRLVTFSYQPKSGAEAEIYKAIGDICISMKAKDWLDLPERVDVLQVIKLRPAAMDAYKRLEKEYILQMESGDIEASSAAVLTNKLLQLANGAAYDENKAVQVIHDQKLEALEDIIEAANGKPVLVFYAYRHDLARIQECFKTAVKLESSDQIKAWNRGEIEILLVHPASAGHGLNLQQGGSIIAWFGLTWSLELYQQANARLHRQGQKERVIIHHIMAEGTVDEMVLHSLTAKDATQEELMQAVKARILLIKNESERN